MATFKISKYLTADEYSNKLRDVSDPRDYLLFYTLWELGLRINEALNLRKEHIDFKEGVLKIYREKTNQERPLPISQDHMRLIRLYTADKKSGLIFDIKSRRAYDLSMKYFGIKPHAIRHSRAIYLVTHGVPVETIRRLLGHSRLDVTQIYLDYDYNTMRKDLNSGLVVI